jgi:dolichyl-phosphate-mannose--protein O-mannosyl transferase
LLARIFSKRLNQYLAGQPTGIDEPSAPHKAKIFAEGAISIIFLLVIGFSVYVIPFVIHFDLLQRSGPGDAFMSQQFQQELKYGRQSVEQPLSFWQKFVELNKTMYTASAGITAFHPYSSRWYNWPFDDKPIYYWNQNLPSNQVAKIYFLGNPVLWWLAGAFIITTLLTSTRRSWRKKISPIFYILLLGYFANLLPFIFIKRTSFLYHYLPPVTFGILLVSLWLANLWPKDKKILLLTLTIVAAVFVFLIPLCYGLPMSPPLNGVEMNLIQLLS